MRRREFVGLVGSTAILPFAARAQPANAPVVGFLSSRSPEEAAVHTSAFRRGLAEAGFVEGQNVSIVFRWAEGHYERLPALGQGAGRPSRCRDRGRWWRTLRAGGKRRHGQHPNYFRDR